MKTQRQLNLCILSRSTQIYSTKRLMEEAQKMQHQVHVVNFSQCCVQITASGSYIVCRGAPIGHFDAVIPRIGVSHSFYGTAVLRQIETMGAYSINPSIAISRSRDKLRCLQLLARHGIDLPATAIAHKARDISRLIEWVGGPPVVIKVIEGTQGIGVVLAETRQAAESTIQAFLGVKTNIIIQEYIPESSGTDIRCLVVGRKVVASMARLAPPGEFRSNLHRGGTGQPIDITDQERDIAVYSAKTLGLNVAGVDLLRSKRGPLVIEVNSSPGLRGIESVTQKNVARSIIRFLTQRAKPITTRSYYQG